MKNTQQKTKNSTTNVKIVPYKYNGGQLYIEGKKPKELAKYTINPDWVEISTLGRFIDPEKPEDIIYFDDSDIILIRDENRANGTKHFRFVYLIYVDGEQFGHINTIPRSSTLDANISLLKVENYLLYKRGWINDLSDVINSMGVSFYNISRLDIAIDGHGFLSDYGNIITKKYKKVGRAKTSTEHKANGDVEGFYVGSKSSEKFIRGYNKTVELKKSQNKGYIELFWIKNNLDRSKEVERLELTLKSKAIKKVKDFDWTKIGDADYLAGMMKSMLKGFYQFTDNENKDTNVTRKEKIEAVDWSYFDCIKVDRLSKVDKPSVVWAAQQKIRFDMMESYAGLEDTGEHLWENAYAKSYDTAKKYGILKWFGSQLPKWKKKKEFKDLMREKVKEVKADRWRSMEGARMFTQM